MSAEAQMFKEERYGELWQRCCGFLDLSIGDFMKVQKRLLREQIELLTKCELGRKIMGGLMPESVEGFRAQVPLTTYEDYAPYLLKRRMDVLPRKPIIWQCTSGKSGEYPLRWAPVTADQLAEVEQIIFALMLLCSCRGRGDFSLRPNDRVLYGMAPPPYTTGTMTRAFPHELFTLMPPLEESEVISFEERMQKGFQQALEKGMDMNIAMSSVAVAIGERFSRRGNTKMSKKYLLAHPGMAIRLAKGLLKSKLARRQLLPRDLWRLKGLITFGIDTEVYREKIKEMWGRNPLEFYGCTEAIFIAAQTWDYGSMTFIPNLNFLEFIPEEDVIKSKRDPGYQPRTFLLDEIKPGNYELVITSLHGGPFIRYRLGHLIKVTSLRNEKLNIDIPQMVFLTRVDDQIDIAGFTRLSERIIWKAIENTGLAYRDWVARKEVDGSPSLHLYIELEGNGRLAASRVAELVHEELKKLDAPYAELESFTGLAPLKVTLLPQGAFAAYTFRQKAAGASLSQQKAEHINPDDEVIDFLLNKSKKIKVVTSEEKVEA